MNCEICNHEKHKNGCCKKCNCGESKIRHHSSSKKPPQDADYWKGTADYTMERWLYGYSVQ